MSPNPYQGSFQPMPFEVKPNGVTSYQSDHSYQNSINSSDSTYAHNNQHQRFLQYQHRLMQQQDKGESLSELEILKLKQKQDRQHLLEAMQQQQKYQKYQPNYQEHHIIKKQYSETSIPSTNADPLYSNSPTPPMMNHKVPKNSKNEKTSKNYLDNNQFYLANNKNTNNKDHYFKLNEEQEKGEVLIRFLSSDSKTMNKTLNLIATREQKKRDHPLIKDKYTSNDYKQYQKNFGFGKEFLPFENETKAEKIEKARKREEYSKMIKERNTNPKQTSNTLIIPDNVNNRRNNELDIFKSKKLLKK